MVLRSCNFFRSAEIDFSKNAAFSKNIFREKNENMKDMENMSKGILKDKMAKYINQIRLVWLIFLE